MDAITRAPMRVRHENGVHLAKVVFIEPVTRLMRRITFHAPGLANFSSAAADDHVKLLFPRAGETQPVLPVLGPQGLAFPENMPRPVTRDYTPRRYDPESCELTIEFVLHEQGTASDWARRAKPGDLLGIGGPRGSLIVPDDYEAYLLAGDETALPAIARRLEEMRHGTSVLVIIEVADRHEQRHFPTAANAQVTWLHRNCKPAGQSGLLEEAMRSTRLPSRDIFAWVACEIEVARNVRKYLMEEEGLARSQVRAAGYWKIGEAGAHESIE